jgi:hypothetical protein
MPKSADRKATDTLLGRRVALKVAVSAHHRHPLLVVAGLA